MQNDDRKLLRKALIKQRKGVSRQQQRHASKLISQRLVNSLLFLRSNRIAFYFSNQVEVDTSIVLKKALAMGKACYFPILHPIKHNEMWFGKYECGDPLTKNCFGIPEPYLLRRECAAPWSLDLVIAPLVAFDSRGNRLGMGGGFYDRTFSFLQKRMLSKPKMVGLAYEFQHVTDLPAEEWDVSLDIVITEANLYVFDSHPRG